MRGRMADGRRRSPAAPALLLPLHPSPAAARRSCLARWSRRPASSLTSPLSTKKKRTKTAGKTAEPFRFILDFPRFFPIDFY